MSPAKTEVQLDAVPIRKISHRDRLCDAVGRLSFDPSVLIVKFMTTRPQLSTTRTITGTVGNPSTEQKWFTEEAKQKAKDIPYELDRANVKIMLLEDRESSRKDSVDHNLRAQDI